MPLKLVFEPLIPRLSSRKLFSFKYCLHQINGSYSRFNHNAESIFLFLVSNFVEGRNDSTALITVENKSLGMHFKTYISSKSTTNKDFTRKSEGNKFLFGNLMQQLLIAFSIDIDFCAIVFR